MDNVKYVREVQEKLNEAGYQALSNIEWLEQTEKQSGMLQAALVFSVVVGMAAGFFPALRAMPLSPLAAIRNE